MNRKERYLVGLDVGTSHVCAVVGESLDDGRLNIVGLGVAESRGIKRGVIVNLEAAVDTIKKAIGEAELMAGIEVDSVHLSLWTAHQGVQQPWCHYRGRQEQGDHTGRRAAGDRCGKGSDASRRP